MAKFAIATCFIATFWLVALPQLGRWEPIRSHVDRLNSNRINAAAMFYTELESPVREAPVREVP